MNADVSTARSRRGAWWRGALLTAALAGTAALVPAQRAHAADVQVRVLVDVADLIFRSGRPYYHDRGYYHPVVVEYDRWHRPVYYRYEPRPGCPAWTCRLRCTNTRPGSGVSSMPPPAATPPAWSRTPTASASPTCAR